MKKLLSARKMPFLNCCYHHTTCAPPPQRHGEFFIFPEITFGAGDGAVFHIPHGCCNAILLPYVIQYNSRVCMERYARIARTVGPACEFFNCALRKRGALFFACLGVNVVSAAQKSGTYQMACAASFFRLLCFRCFLLRFRALQSFLKAAGAFQMVLINRLKLFRHRFRLAEVHEFNCFQFVHKFPVAGNLA